MVCFPSLEKLSPEASLAQFSEDVYKFTCYQSFRELATLSYGDQATECCVVTSLDFDKDGEFFAVAGATKKIEVHVRVCMLCTTLYLNLMF